MFATKKILKYFLYQKSTYKLLFFNIIKINEIYLI
jgi:hypothetical protein